MRPSLERWARRGLGVAGGFGLFAASAALGAGPQSSPVPVPPVQEDISRLTLSTRYAPKIFSEMIRGRPEVLRALIAAGEDVNGRDPQGMTAVMAATYNGKTPLLEILLNAGADPNLTDRAGRTALYIAIWYGRTDATRLLLAKGADTARIHTSGLGALAYAASLGRRPQVEMLMAAGADALTEGPGGAPIHFAAARQDRALLEWLLARGEDIGRPAAATGMTPLMHAARYGSPSGVGLVLGYHPDANQQDKAGWTALMHAAHRDRVENAEVLLAAGVDCNVAGAAGETAYLLAARRGHVALQTRLAAAGATVVPVRLAAAAMGAWSEERRFAWAMAALEQHVNAGDESQLPNVTADARRNLSVVQGVADAEELKRRLDELLRPEAAGAGAAAGPAVADLTAAEFQARIAAVADDPVQVVALRNARQQRSSLGAQGLLAWRLCHHNYLAATAVAAGWLPADDGDARMAAAAKLLRARYRDWAEVAPALVAGLGAKGGGIPRWEALVKLFLDGTDPNSPWGLAPFAAPVRL